MLRYATALASVISLVVAIRAPTPGIMGFAILMMLLCATISIFGFAAARISSRSQTQVYVPSPEEIALLKQRAQRQREAHDEQRGGGA